MTLSRSSLLGAGALLAGVLAQPALAETLNCTPIVSVPATISTSGIYCLTGNLATSDIYGDGIYVTAPNVTIDLNGWTLDGPGAAMAHPQAVGISDSDMFTNVTVKNGTVRGFYRGVSLSSYHSVIRDIRADSNAYMGIWTKGEDSVIEHNEVINTGGAGDVNVYGVYAIGARTKIIDNMVSGLTATGYGNETGIYVRMYSLARGNFITDFVKPTGGGTSFGIYGYESNILSNSVTNFDTCIYNYLAGHYAQNIVSRCTTNYSGGTAGAGNSP